MTTTAEVLEEVREMGPVTMDEVARNLGISRSTAWRMLRRLEAAGVIESDDYQRRARVFLPA